MTTATITRFEVGNQIIITAENINAMQNSNRACVTPNYPSNDFIDKAIKVMQDEMIGTVTHTFLPGFEVTARFSGDISFHMKDHWITKST